ncbi:MAG: hypothetical protein HC906_18520 [Bacteroidales bacterium]|nr:hypothetical protein [Bacteroidales bacterium]
MGKGIKIITGIVFILAGSILLSYAQKNNRLSNDEAMKSLLHEMELVNYKISSIMVKVAPVAKEMNTITSEDILYAEAIEEEVKIEEWMLDQDHFANAFETEKEQEIKIEDWMLDQNHFTTKTTEFEAPVEIESWMLDSTHWTVK